MPTTRSSAGSDNLTHADACRNITLRLLETTRAELEKKSPQNVFDDACKRLSSLENNDADDDDSDSKECDDVKTLKKIEKSRAVKIYSFFSHRVSRKTKCSLAKYPQINPGTRL